MFFAVSARDILYYLWLFQVKEYRIDRIISHFRENRIPDKTLVIGLMILCLYFLLLLSAFSISITGIFNIDIFSFLDFDNYNRNASVLPSILGLFIFIIFFLNITFGYWLSIIYFVLSFFKTLQEIKIRSLKRPKLTAKILLIFCLFSLTYLALTFLVIKENSEEIIFIEIASLSVLLPIIMYLIIIFINPFSNWQKKKVIKAATEKRRSLKHVRTIGITGSYGKTSTKEFLYAILSSKHKVIKTEGNNNTAMGVANTVLRKVSDDFDFFICEMGAYKIGEIKEICEISQPEIGIITGINEQHIELFGSIENTKKAKFELLESLPETGIAIINESTLRMKPEVKFRTQNIFLFSKELAQNISVTPDYVEFQYKEASFRLNALGAHYIGNLMSAIIVAEHLGMSLSEISAAISKIEIKGRYLMQKISGPKNTVFIDDSYSANPDGVIASLEYIETAYPDYKKVFVFPGIIELGKRSEEIHQKIWQKVNESFRTAYIIQKNNKDIQKKYTKCHFVFEKNFDKISQEVENEIEEKTVVLFESRGAGVVMQKILKKR